MDPQLVASSGPLKGAIFKLVEEEVSIGRESSNRISINDLSLSRRHCCLKVEASQVKICDLDSLNGTFVNGLPVKEQFLHQGDQIKLGDSQFFFLLTENEPPLTPGRVVLEEGGLVALNTIQLRSEESLYLQPSKVQVMLLPTERVARDLNTLLRISRAISSIRSLEALKGRLLDLILEIIPAERGAILLLGEQTNDFASVFGRDRVSTSDRPIQVSRTVVRQILSEKVALLSNDILDRKAFSTSESLIESQIRSLLCVPLAVLEEVSGMIYLDSSDPSIRFDEGHLQLLTAIASIAAVTLETVRQVEHLDFEKKRLQNEINMNHNMIGDSPRMCEVYRVIGKSAPSDLTMLIRGESGTGKELAAREVHQRSPRADKPFVAINCATLNEALLEDELFGHEKGAFTNAIAHKKGKLEVADGGTIFLDEVAELTPLVQAKLLRVLQEREFERVGGTRPIKVDLRLITATNKDLEQAVKSGGFREDLYFRLNVIRLSMPPLRERREDIPLLAIYFTGKYSEKCKRRVKGISLKARECLLRYDWPGNVRELENAMANAVVMGSTDLILPEDLPESVLESESIMASPVGRYHETLKETKKQLILKALEQASGNFVEGARVLGLHPNYLHRLIRNLNLRAVLDSGKSCSLNSVRKLL
jgi:Nif-specific regulatory protein